MSYCFDNDEVEKEQAKDPIVRQLNFFNQGQSSQYGVNSDDRQLGQESQKGSQTYRSQPDLSEAAVEIIKPSNKHHAAKINVDSVLEDDWDF